MQIHFFKQTFLLFLAAFGIAVFGMFFSDKAIGVQCTLGETICSDNGAILECTQAEPGINYWRGSSCGTNKTCSAGKCIPMSGTDACEKCIHGCNAEGQCLPSPEETVQQNCNIIQCCGAGFSKLVCEDGTIVEDCSPDYSGQCPTGSQTAPNTGIANTGNGSECQVVCDECSPGFSSLVCNGSIVESCTPDTSGLCGEAENTPSEQGGQEYNLFPTQSLQDTEDSSSDNCKVGGTMCGTCPESIRGNDRAKKFYQQYHNMLYGTFPPCDGQTQEQNPPATPLPIEPAESQEDSSTVITPTSKPVHIVVTPTDVPSVNSGWFPPAEY